MSAYTVVNRLGVTAQGQHVPNGGTIELDDDTAASLVKVGAVEPQRPNPPKSTPRKAPAKRRASK